MPEDWHRCCRYAYDEMLLEAVVIREEEKRSCKKMIWKNYTQYQLMCINSKSIFFLSVFTDCYHRSCQQGCKLLEPRERRAWVLTIQFGREEETCLWHSGRVLWCTADLQNRFHLCHFSHVQHRCSGKEKQKNVHNTKITSLK